MNIATIRPRPNDNVGQEPGDSPQQHASGTDRADRAAAGELYEALVSGDRTSPGCVPIDHPAHDFDQCGAEPVVHARLFAQEDKDAADIDIHDVRQGDMRDCYFMATLAPLAQSPQGRALIRSAITEKRNDRGDVVTYTVTLHRPEMHWVGRTTFSEVHVTVDARFATGHAVARPGEGVNEVWPLVMEKAYAQLSGGHNAIARGGVPSDAMQVLTGREATHTEFRWFHRWLPPCSAGELQRALDAGNPVVLSSRRDAREFGLVGGHAYVVTEVKDVDGRLCVILHNPWNLKDPSPVPVDQIGRYFHAINVGSVR